MTITSIVLNFREALLGLIPRAESVGITWGREDAYDEWDAVASSLYDNLVVAVLREYLAEIYRDDFQLPPYDLLINDYKNLATIGVNHPSLESNTRWVFNSFGMLSEAFDVLEVRPVSDEGIVIKKDVRLCPIEQAKFSLNWNQDGRNCRAENTDQITRPKGK
jgi:hypothetical protein